MNNIFTIKNFAAVVISLIVFPVFPQTATSQWPAKNQDFLQGFEKHLSGEVLDFLPGLTNGQVALLIRATDGRSILEFQSSVVPASYNKEIVSFVWSAAISRQTAGKPGKFTMYINDEEYFTFQSHKDSVNIDWTLTKDGTSLSFVATEITKGTADAFGYMFLNIPASRVRKGEPLRIRVIGGNDQVMDWYMPFGITVKNDQIVLAEPALVNSATGLKQRIRVEVHHADKPSAVRFMLDGKQVLSARLKPGKTVFYLFSDPVEKPKDVLLEAIIEGKSTTRHPLVLNPVRKFEVYFLAHSHIDIGFTHKQDEVEKLQWKNLELAMDLAERTRDYPDGAQFKWNAEITWAVDGYLKNASPEKKQRFLDAVRNGWIGLDALYASQLTGLQREEEMINNQRFALQFEKDYGFDINSAMISDVPGYSWGMVESLAQSGIRYFSSGPNHMPHLPHGGYQVGHTLETWGDVPFYWKSASGEEKVLFWMTSHGYSWFHSWSIDILSKSGGDPVVKFLDELDKQRYPYDIVQLRYTIGNDNGPPDETMPDFVRTWNETYAYPKFRIATTSEMMSAFEKRYGEELPVLGGDFTPYWEDGAASSAVETGINRKTADRLVQAETLHALLGSSPAHQETFDKAWRNVLLFSEHTWGANISKSQPESEFTKSLWSVKQGFALKGASLADSLIALGIDAINQDSHAESIEVINTLSWPRTGLVTIPQSWNPGNVVITDEQGKTIETQTLSDGSLVFVASDVPAMAGNKYSLQRVRPGRNKKKNDPPAKGDQLALGKMLVAVDPHTGDITRMTVSEGANLVDASDTLGFNAYWYGGLIKSNLKKQSGAEITFIEDGPVLRKLRITSSAPGANGLTRELTLINGIDALYITNIVDKQNITADENVRFTFPFNIPGGQVRIDVPWATVRPEHDQLDGANKNFYSIQRWVDISNAEYGVTLAPIEAPLLEIGDMNGQKWMADMSVRPWIRKYEPSTRLFSWVMNNAWFVNYKASQDGEIPFHYVLRPHTSFNHTEAKKFGIEQTQPLLVVRATKNSPSITPPFRLADDSGIIVTSLKYSRDAKALMIRLFNASETTTQTRIEWHSLKPRVVSESSPAEEVGAPTGTDLSMKAWQVMTLRAELP